MIAGTIALLEGTADDELESKSSGFSTLDVRETLTYLDHSTVQHGRACAHVDTQHEEVFVDGTTIETETVSHPEEAYTEWVADVTDAGFIVTERTAGSDSAFPFDLFEVATGCRLSEARLDPGAFITAQREAENAPDVWFSGSKAETEDDLDPDDVDMAYGRDANQAGGNVGVGFRTSWNGRRIKGIMYASGYLAVYSDWVDTTAFAQFVREEVLPHTETPDGEGGQATLDESECIDCGRETDTNDDGLCIVCQDKREEEQEGEFGNLDTVTMSDGGEE